MNREMKITFFGAAGGVTGSRHFLEIGRQKILFDCGFFQGRRSETYQANSVLPEKMKEATAVILSHAHADHCCSLPLLVKNGFVGPIYATSATAAIAHLIMLDAAKIQSGDYNYLIKRGFKNLLPPVYDEDDVEKTRHLFKDVGYHVNQTIGSSISFKFYDAGHILGSAVTVLKTPEKNIVYTGDLGNVGLPILPDPEMIKEEAEIIISESTYGDREHSPVKDSYDLIKKLVLKIIKEKSRIIIPAFALGRTQEIIYILHKLYKDGNIPAVPIYVDSPLSNNITDVFRQYNSDFDLETWQDFLMDGDSPFSFNRLNYIETVEESKSLNNKTGPLIIIASSGMLEGGRVLHHLRNDIGNPKSTILLTGYQAENTLGRRLEMGAKTAKIFGEEFKVKERIIKIDKLSAHADRWQLLDYIEKIKGLKKVFLVHGEKEAAISLAKLIKEKKPYLEVIIPKLGETFKI